MGLLSLSYAQKQTDILSVENLDEVVITDSRFAIKRENSGKTVIKITQQELQNNQGRTLANIINTKSGIEINGSRSVAGQNLGYFVRGGNNRQVLVLIDGIQVNDPSLVSNEFDLRLIDLSTISSVEIIKGSASTLYGNAAATAVINITTKKASKKRLSGSFMSVVGTNNSQNNLNSDINNFTNSVSVNGSLDKFNYVLSFSNQFSDGISAAKGLQAEDDTFSKYNTYLKMGYDVSEKFKITAFASLDKFKTDIDGFPAPSFTFADTNDTFISEQQRVGISPKLNYKNGSFQINAAYTNIDRNTVSSFSTVNEAESWVVDAFNKYTFNTKFKAIIGLNYGEFKSLFNTEERYTNTDPYLNVLYTSDYGLNLNAGGRFNNHSAYGSQLVYHINPSYSIPLTKGYAKLFGSYATSFIAPNLSQLFGFFGANPDLNPEENSTIEGGLEFNTKKGIRFNSVYFRRNEQHTIIYTTAYENALEDATVQGFEVEAEVSTIKNLSIAANYTFIEVLDGERLRIPKHKINLNLGYQFSKTSYGAIDTQFVGERTDLNFNTFENETLASYANVNLYFSRALIQKKLKLFARVDNLFNEDYFEILDYTTRGRTVSLGLNLNL